MKQYVSQIDMEATTLSARSRDSRPRFSFQSGEYLIRKMTFLVTVRYSGHNEIVHLDAEC